MKMLMVEYDEFINKMFTKICDSLGVEVQFVLSGSTAFELCATGAAFDLILMSNCGIYYDERIGATLDIRRLPHGSSYIILMVTGFDDEFATDDVLKNNGFDGFYRKPINVATFSQIIKKLKD